MIDILQWLGLGEWKPVLTALVLPPVPWLLMVLLGAWWLSRRRPVGWLLVVPACVALWFCSTIAVGEALVRGLLPQVSAMGPAEVLAMRQKVAANPGTVAIVVLGGGRESLAPEYGVSNLTARSIERLRYGIWLSRETGAPVAFSGGVGHAGAGATPEAEIAVRVAAREFGHPLKWTETASRDTRENAAFTISLLKPVGVKRVVVVTHGWHMARAMAEFNDAVQRGDSKIEVSAAPMGLAASSDRPLLRWMPSNEGQTRVRDALREWIARLTGI
ncbi:MAG TPA: YdcF family protein [Rubrivivax sp.]